MSGTFHGVAAVFLLTCPVRPPTHTEKTFGLFTFVDFQEMIITESRSEIVGDIQELEIFGLETHMLLFLFTVNLIG